MLKDILGDSGRVQKRVTHHDKS